MMIRADHKRWAGWLFYPYMDRIFRKDYTHFFLTNNMPSIPEEYGLLITPNHISWWDGFFIDFLMRCTSRRQIHLMMLKTQLAQVAFFRFLGAYSIDPGYRKAVMEAIEYTAEVLEQNNTFAVVYPQGEIVPQRSGPLEFREGVLFSLRKVKRPVLCLPVIFLVKPYNERHPEIWCRFGRPAEGKDVLRDFKGYEEHCNREVFKLEEDIRERRFTEDLFTRKRRFGT